ncbi:hypothetical protein NG726_15765 [Pseudomonas sp. MOB-449]|nr:hypothetical protein [Pseudomonas sp. MOB-449]
MRYLCLPTPVTYVPRLNTMRTAAMLATPCLSPGARGAPYGTAVILLVR